MEKIATFRFFLGALMCPSQWLLELYSDENEGYFENAVAPESKVFVHWRMQDGRAMPVRASVSYVEGTRMFDSGESADGVDMPAEIQVWLADYLREHYQPKPRRGRISAPEEAVLLPRLPISQRWSVGGGLE